MKTVKQTVRWSLSINQDLDVEAKQFIKHHDDSRSALSKLVAKSVKIQLEKLKKKEEGASKTIPQKV